MRIYRNRFLALLGMTMNSVGMDNDFGLKPEIVSSTTLEFCHSECSAAE